jgi:tRNA nucleotidyltransferase/poly(A) polymerase
MTTNSLNSLINKVPLTLRGIAKRLECAGHETYFVGGCVRDLLTLVDSST